MSRPILPLLTAVAVSLLLAAHPTPALACTPTPGGPVSYTAAERAQNADLVFLGTVTEVFSVEGEVEDHAHIDVLLYYKGQGVGREVSVGGFGSTALCLSPLNVGDYLIFFVRIASDGTLHAQYMGQFDAVAQPDEATLAEIEAVTGQLPVTPIPAEAALACTPSPDPGSADLSERTRESDLVFLGTVNRVTGENSELAVVDVELYLKAQGDSYQIIMGRSSPVAECLEPLNVGDRLIFFATYDPDGILRAHHMRQFDEVARPDEATLAEISRAAGQAPVTPQALVSIQAATAAPPASEPIATPVPPAPSPTPEPPLIERANLPLTLPVYALGLACGVLLMVMAIAVRQWLRRG